MLVDDKLVELARRLRESGYYAAGGKIHIKKSKEGTFTAAAKKHGKSVQAFASQVLANKENYSPAMVKKANFARNAAKWHADGGPLYDPNGVLWAPSAVTGFVLPDADTLALRQRYAESAFDDSARSPSGALGAYQIMPKTYEDYVRKTGKKGDLLNHDFNRGVRDWYMGELSKSATVNRGEPLDSVRAAKLYAAYNWGVGNLGKYLQGLKDAGQDIYKSTDWIEGLPKETRDYVNFIVFGRDVPDTSKTYDAFDKAYNAYRQFAEGGPVGGGEGGYTTSKSSRERVNGLYDPTLGFGLASAAINFLRGGNRSHGEENEYWRAYLGLDNTVPAMNPDSKTSWDDAVEAKKASDGELPSDFYGTTPRMDQMIQVLGDTLNTGRIVRDYDAYKKANPRLAEKQVIQHIYEQGKNVMNNPNRWVQVEEGPQIYLYENRDINTNEKMPLGMLADFGMMWSPEEQVLKVHDTYDLPKYVTSLTSIPVRPKEMKIRGRVQFDPERGSVLLRDGLDESKQAAPVATRKSH